MTHPRIDEVISAKHRLEAQLSRLIVERSTCLEKNLNHVTMAIQDVKTKLATIKRHESENFEGLLHALDRGDYCPFCFIFDQHLFKLVAHTKYSRYNKLECSICDAAFDR